MIAALVGLLVVAPSASGSFGAPTNYNVGDQPYDVAVGKFNEDIHPDLAVTSIGSDTGDDFVSVMLGLPGGTFGPPSNIPVGEGPQAIAVGEFNQDGDRDLAITNFANSGGQDGSVSALLGGPGGGFAGAFFPLNATPTDVAIGDFNLAFDSDPDLAIPTYDHVAVLLGGSQGSFGAPTTYEVEPYASSVVVGNFNLPDTYPDLAVAGRTNLGGGRVSLLLALPGGGFAPHTTFPVGQSPTSIATADFNSDTYPDLVTASRFDNNVSVLLGAPGGTFGPKTDFPVGSEPWSVAVGDFNRDFDPDLAVSNRGNRRVSVLLGGSGGTFGSPIDHIVGGKPSSVAVADINLDSRDDIVVSKQEDNNVGVLINMIDAPEITATSPNSPANDNNPEVKGSGAEANSTVKIYGDATCTGTVLGSGTAAAFNGPGGITATVAGDATTNLRVTATDMAGNASACSALRAYTEDSTAPDTQILTAPLNISNDPTGDFAFSATGGHQAIECKLDGGPFSVCTSPFATSTLAEGSHTFQVRATDAAGNIDQTPASFTWTVDTIAPAAPAINDTDPNSPANDNNPEVKGTGAEAGSTVKIYNNANRSCTNLVATGTAAALNGAVGITVPVPANATFNLRVTATDQAGNTSACSGPDAFPYIEDSNAPATPTITDTDPDSPANENNPGVKGSGAEAGSAVSITSCTGTVYGTGTAAAFNAGPGVIAAVPGDTTTNLHAVATDQAGNNSNCSTPFPYTETSSITGSPDINDTDPDSPSSDPRPSVQGRAPAGSTVTIFASDRCTASQELISGPASEFEEPGLPTRVESNTTTIFTATATVGGNTSACSRQFEYVEDEEPPNTVIDTSPPSLSNDPTGDFTFSSVGGGVSFECRLDGGPLDTFSPCGTPHATASLSDGSHTLEVRAIDAAFNADGTPASHTWTVDATAPAAPTITATSPASPANDNNPEVIGTVGSGSPVQVNIYADLSTCGDNGDANGNVAAFTGAGITVPVQGDHTTQLYAKALDQAGNDSSCSGPFVYVEDSTIADPPETTITRMPKNNKRRAKAKFQFSSSKPGSTFTCELDRTPVSACTSPTKYKGLKKGRHAFEVFATDTGGNPDPTPATYRWKIKRKR